MLTMVSDGPCIAANFSQRGFNQQQQEVSISQALVATTPRIIFERNTKSLQRRHLGLFQADQPREQYSRWNTTVCNRRALGCNAPSSQPVFWRRWRTRNDTHIGRTAVDGTIFAALVTYPFCPEPPLLCPAHYTLSFGT